MLTWLKRIGLFAAFLIAVELVAYVGLTLLGPNAFRQIRTVLDPFGDPTPAVATTLDGGGQQRCTTYQGEMFCITEGVAPASVQDSAAPSPDRAASVSQRCATYEGATICIEEDH